jgi:DNA repair exonuclease SbcCD ATPase subunit
LVLAGAALWFEFQLNDKRAELKDRNRMQEDFIMEVARLTEEAADASSATVEVEFDNGAHDSPDAMPDMENVLDKYDAGLEKAVPSYFKWGDMEREGLREVYVLDGEGNVVMDGSDPKTAGSREEQLLAKLKKALEAQKESLAKTRAALPYLRGQVEYVAKKSNELKKELRDLHGENEDLAKAKEEADKKCAEAEGQLPPLKQQIESLNNELVSVRDEVVTAKDETEAVKEELAKEKKNNEQLKKLLRDALTSAATAGVRAQASQAVASITAGEKGRVIEVESGDEMFAVIELNADALKELKGPELNRPIAVQELGVRRPGYNGPAGDFVGKVRIRQEIAGKPYVVCDILSNWSQTAIQPGDAIFAD